MPRPPSSPFDTYLREIAAVPLLTAAEERSLARRIAAGDASARDYMIRANLRLVVRIARGFTGRGLGFEDLVSEGNFGLMIAVRKYDPDRGTRFSTCAGSWIKQAIARAIVDKAPLVRVPAHMDGILNRWRRAAVALRQELDRDATPDEIGARLGLSEKQLVHARAAQATRTTTFHLGHESPFSGVVAAHDTMGEIDADDHAEDDKRRIAGCLQALPPREALILRMRYGLDGHEPATLERVGAVIGVTRERTRQIEIRAVKRLAVVMGSGERLRAEVRA